ncbi:MAG: AAA family ATPase [Rhodomicrobium sp.]
MRRDLNDELRVNGPDAVRARLDRAERFEPEVKTGRANGRDAKTKAGLSEKTKAIIALLPESFACDEEMRLTAPEEIIKGILPERGTGLLIGPSGALKTTVALDMSCAVTTGGTFFGRDVRLPGAVVYVAAEGGGGIERRFKAVRKHRAINHALPFVYTRKALNLKDNKDLNALVANLKQVSLWSQQKFGVPLRLVIIDTMSTAFVIEDENNNAVIADVCRRLARIEEETGAFCLGVHHTGKDAGKGARGGSAYRANVDNELTCSAERDATTGKSSNYQFAVTKFRDGPEGPVGGFEREFVELGVDKYGDPFGALAIVFTGLETKKASKPRTGAQKLLDDAVNAELIDFGVKIRVDGDGPEVTAADLQKVRRRFNGSYVTGEDDNSKRQEATRQAWKRALDHSTHLYTRRQIETGEFIWRLQ